MSYHLGTKDLRDTGRLELDSLRQYTNPEEIILRLYDNLDPGQMIVLIDDYNPGWIRELIDRRRLDRSDEALFRVENRSDRYELYVAKPPASRQPRRTDDIPEVYIG